MFCIIIVFTWYSFNRVDKRAAMYMPFKTDILILILLVLLLISEHDGRIIVHIWLTQYIRDTNIKDSSTPAAIKTTNHHMSTVGWDILLSSISISTNVSICIIIQGFARYRNSWKGTYWREFPRLSHIIMTDINEAVIFAWESMVDGHLFATTATELWHSIQWFEILPEPKVVAKLLGWELASIKPVGDDLKLVASIAGVLVLFRQR